MIDKKHTVWIGYVFVVSLIWASNGWLDLPEFDTAAPPHDTTAAIPPPPQLWELSLIQKRIRRPDELGVEEGH